MKQNGVLVLVIVALICGCRETNEKRQRNNRPASAAAGTVGAIDVPVDAPDSPHQNQVQAATIPTETPRLEAAEEKRFVERPGCVTTAELVWKQHEAAVPLILATLDRLPGETNAPSRCAIVQGVLWNPENCTNIQFRAIIQRGTNDLSESVRRKTTVMVSNAIVRLRASDSPTK
jgi:hypothetical protein